jgi:hypothetical protein
MVSNPAFAGRKAFTTPARAAPRPIRFRSSVSRSPPARYSWLNLAFRPSSRADFADSVRACAEPRPIGSFLTCGRRVAQGLGFLDARCHGKPVDGLWPRLGSFPSPTSKRPSWAVSVPRRWPTRRDGEMARSDHWTPSFFVNRGATRA